MAEVGVAAVGYAGDAVGYGDGAEGAMVSDSGVGGSELPSCRRSARKLLRSPLSRGRRAKSCPKSPLMRMAEMRKGGLRGKVLKQSRKYGSKESKVDGRRGSEALAVIPESSELGVEAPSGLELDDGAVGGSGEGLREDGCSWVASGDGSPSVGAGSGGEGSVMAGIEEDVVGEGSFSLGLAATGLDVSFPAAPELGVALLGSGSGGSALDRMTEGSVVGFSSDLALDLISSQPLQDMAFIDKSV